MPTGRPRDRAVTGAPRSRQLSSTWPSLARPPPRSPQPTGREEGTFPPSGPLCTLAPVVRGPARWGPDAEPDRKRSRAVTEGEPPAGNPLPRGLAGIQIQGPR
ncbi:uncharacterized protein LOC115275192 [Suricata suricatta]|uniref:uncharacterized protein LOC115275192 n=1 Tax=Suricata suricatta TaxID=37032 RepID=UPI00115539D4|nr:uncharacterized protein LOC115275192 [Suricata suricatta]